MDTHEDINTIEVNAGVAAKGAKAVKVLARQPL